MAGLEFVPEGPCGYLIEKEPFDVAIVPAQDMHPGSSATSDPRMLLYSVLLNPRQIPAGFTDFEIIKVRGRRIGRTIDVLLDEPVEVGGKEYPVVTFKGTGALPDKNDPRHDEGHIIDPLQWRSSSVQQFGRLWGAVIEQGAKIEAQKPLGVLHTFGILATPYLSANVIPSEITGSLYRGDAPWDLAQPVRLTDTNILLDDVFYWRDRKDSINPFFWMTGYGRGCADRKAILSYIGEDTFEQGLLDLIERIADASRSLAREGRALKWALRSECISNTYMNGRLKDFENMTIGEREDEDSSDIFLTIHGEIMSNLDLLRQPRGQKVFLSEKCITDYVRNEGCGPAILKVADRPLPERILHVPPEHGGPGFAVLGLPCEGGGFTWDMLESYFPSISFEEALRIDAGLREDGYALASRNHIKRMWDRYRSNLFNKFNDDMKFHTGSLFDAGNRILMDGACLSEDGSLDLSSVARLQVPHAEIGSIREWDWAAGWPRRIEGPGNADAYYHGDAEGIVPVIMGLSSYCTPCLTLRTDNPRGAMPLAIYEYH